MTTTPVIAASFVVPQPAVVLSHDSGGFQYRQVCRYRLHHFGRQRALIKGVAKERGARVEVSVVLYEIRRDFLHVLEAAAVPRLEVLRVKIFIIRVKTEF